MRLIVETLQIDNFDERNGKCCCPFHHEDTPSFIYDHKRHMFHCFGCQRNVDIVDAYMISGKTWVEAAQTLFEKANIKYAFGMHKVKSLCSEYRYPHDEQSEDLSAILPYLNGRSISEKTLRHCDVGTDNRGNIAFKYYDTNDVLCLMKYRPARAIKHGEGKMWAQAGSDSKPLLFNMNRINMNEPLLISEGEIDALSSIESGFTNTVSIPFGAGNMSWIEENWDWLEQFDSIILCFDNDKPGQEGMSDAAHRLGSWRTKTVELPKTFTTESGEQIALKDINNVLIACGSQVVMDCIAKAKDAEVDSVADFADIEDVEINELPGIYTGLQPIDIALSRLLFGSFNILTGINGCVDCDTEYFDGTCWKKMDEYKEGDKVLQYNEDGTASLEYPAEYIKEPCAEFLKFEGNGVSQVVTPEHTMIFVDEAGQLQKVPAQQCFDDQNTLEIGFDGRFIQTFNFKFASKLNNISVDGIRIMMAVLLAGKLVPDETNKEYVSITFDSYANYLIFINRMNNCGIKHNKRQTRLGKRVVFKPPVTLARFKEKLYELSEPQYKGIAVEIEHWRSKKMRNVDVICTTNSHEADFFQFVFTALKRPTKIGRYAVYNEFGQPAYEYRIEFLTGADDNTVVQGEMLEKVNAVDGFKYCFMMDSGMFVSRRDGIINVTGNSGKSSFLSQLICQTLEQGYDSWLYSMELPNFMSKNWMQYVLAGAQNTTKKQDERGKIYYTIPTDVKRQISDYYKGRVYIYKDGMHNTIDAIMESMEASARKYGCKLFVIDNLTAISMNSNEDNKWDKQNEFVTTLIDFAKRYNVVVALVIHPKKLDQVRKMNKMDIQGSGGMCDLAHRAVSLYRVTPKEKQGVPGYKGAWKIPPIKCDVLLDILKDRFTGNENLEVGMYYDNASKRFFTNEAEFNFDYAWEPNKHDKSKWIHPACLREAATPFD